MKHIYLFEDRIIRLQQYNVNVEGLSNIIHRPIICPTNTDIGGYIKDNYADAAIALIHKSYRFNNVTIDDVRGCFISAFNIPVVIFSGASNNNIYKDNNGLIMAEINSGVLYHNLKFFHDDFVASQIPNISILVYGKDYLKHQLLQMQYRINALFFNRSINEVLTNDDKEMVSDILRTLHEPKLKEDISKILYWISKPRTNPDIIKDFLDMMQRFINRY